MMSITVLRDKTTGNVVMTVNEKTKSIADHLMVIMPDTFEVETLDLDD